jgi:hypothetical protein
VQLACGLSRFRECVLAVSYLLVVGEVWNGVHFDKEPLDTGFFSVEKVIKSVGIPSQIHLHRRVHAGWSEVARLESFSSILSKMMSSQGRA